MQRALRFGQYMNERSSGWRIHLKILNITLQLLFGWVDDDGYRRFRECVDIRARKNGKSTEAAGLAHDLLLNDGENGPEIYVVANSRDQAKLVFNECTSMRAKSPALRTIEKKRQSDIYTPFNDGIIKPLAAKTNNLDGLNAHGVIQDEWHEQKNSALYDVMVQSQSAREQPNTNMQVMWLCGWKATMITEPWLSYTSWTVEKSG